MHPIRKLVLALAGAFVAMPAAAQSRGAIELGAFGRWTHFSDKLGQYTAARLPAENGFGGGARLGFFVINNLAIEADASYTRVDAAGGGRVSHIPLHAGLTYNVPISERVKFLVGGRFVNNWYGADADHTDQGVGAVAGLRLGPIRVEGTLDYMPKDEPVQDSYVNIGVNAGLSLLLNNCNTSGDMVAVTPGSVRLAPGQQTNFTATAQRCGKASPVAWSGAGGTITQSGQYTAGTAEGTFQVTATEPKSGLSSSASVTIVRPAPTLIGIEVSPAEDTVKVNEAVEYTITGNYSDTTSHPLTDCTLSATGNPTTSGLQVRWGTPGAYTVTAQCERLSDQASVVVTAVADSVRWEVHFDFDVDHLSSAERDSLRVAAESLMRTPGLMIRLGGHADRVGTDQYNCALSWRRARNVEEALLGFGVTRDRIIEVRAFGETSPVAPADVQESWRERNRRTMDKGQWWDRRVVITSQELGAAMGCSEP